MNEYSDNTDELENELNKPYDKNTLLNIKLSDEQLNIINSEHNIVADCTAGSGKSSTILIIFIYNHTINLLYSEGLSLYYCLFR